MATLNTIASDANLATAVTAINAIIAQVNTNTTAIGTKAAATAVTALSSSVDDLKKANGSYVEDHTPVAPPEATGKTFTKSGVHYFFNVPSFKYQGTTYVASEIIAAPNSYSDVTTALIAAQTVGGVFQSGGLLSTSATVIS